MRDVPFESVEAAVKELLSDIGSGGYDDVLKAAGVEAGGMHDLSSDCDVTQGQGLSPEHWYEVFVVLGPLGATMAKDIWTIVVVPELKKRFRSDRLSSNDPTKSGK